jgi:hypothetical protein
MRNLIRAVCVVMVLVGVSVAVHWAVAYHMPLTGAFFLNALPILIGIVFGIFLGIRRPPNPGFYLTGLRVCLVVAFVYGISAWFLETSYQSITPMQDLRQYEKVRQQYWRHDLNAAVHFPAHVPANAERVFFFAVRYVGKTGPIMQLRYTTTPKTLAAMEASFKEMGTIAKGKLPIDLCAGERQPKPMPEDFTVYSLPITPSAARPYAGYWQWRGVAISRARSEIVYWAQEKKKPKVRGDRRGH